MISVDEFKQRLTPDGIESLADEVVLAEGAAHVTEQQFELIRVKLADAYGVDASSIRVVITGSAKLGFSLVEKKNEDGSVRPRFRLFDAGSDIDVAIICPEIFHLIWHELSGFAAKQPWFPLAHRKLGPYLISGWLRPDHFPYSASLRNCRKWFPLFGSLSADLRFGRRKVTAGLFSSFDHLRFYQLRSLRDALSGAAL